MNDAPSFTGGASVTVEEDAGAYSAAWATAISAGPANEGTQALEFLVQDDNANLFSRRPTVAPDGTLSFAAAPNANGSATVKVAVRDDGGTANGGHDRAGEQSSTITVNAANDPPAVPASVPTVNVREDSPMARRFPRSRLRPWGP